MNPEAAFTGERVIPGAVESDLWNEHISRYRFAAQFAGGKRILDVGCGAGYGTALLAESAADALGFDLAEDAVRYASAHYGNVRFRVASADRFPLPTDSRDLITAFEVIEHLEDWRTLLTESHRVLADDGLFFVSTPNKSYYTEARAEAGPNPFHVHEFEFEEFAVALRGVFPFVQILAQNQQQVFVFAGEKAGPLHGAFLETKPRLEEAHFFLGVCSKRPVNLGGFVFAPAAGNLLREREHYIAALRSQLEEVKADRGKLLETYRRKQEELEQGNRWALSLDRELRETRLQVVAERERTREAHGQHAAASANYEEKMAELEKELAVRAQWGFGLDAQVAAQAARLRRIFDVAARSKWLRLGRALRIGPRFDDPSL